MHWSHQDWLKNACNAVIQLLMFLISITPRLAMSTGVIFGAGCRWTNGKSSLARTCTPRNTFVGGVLDVVVAQSY